MGTQLRHPGSRHPRRAGRRVGLFACLGLALASAAGAASPSLARELARAPRAQVATQAVARHAVRLPMRATRTRLSIRANLLGASWKGRGERIELRARGTDGRWSRWVSLRAEPDEGPDGGSPEAQRSAGRVLVPLPVWVGEAVEAETRAVAGEQVAAVRLVSVNSTGSARLRDRVQTHLRRSAAAVLGVSPDAHASPAHPTIVSRAGWGADESIRLAEPSYADRLKGAVVHHTVSVNGYDRDEVAAMIRGIYSYHVQANGWNDIGYNFLVDRFGRAYEGRYGGMIKPVIGAHAMGFNTGTSGIAFLGTYTSTAPSASARSTLTRLLSWRLDLAHVNPAASMTLTSAGNPTYSAGTVVTRRAVSGHRDFYPTACPGSSAYTRINSIRDNAWTSGGPKFANPTAVATIDAGGFATRVLVAAQGNRVLDYTLVLTRSSDGAAIAQLQQRATDAAITWNEASPLGPVYGWDVQWRLEARAAGIAATPYQRRLLDVPPPVQFDLLSSGAAVVSPNGDGLADRMLVPFRLNTLATIRATVVEQANHGIVVRTVWASRAKGPGDHLFSWGGLGEDGITPAAPAHYTLRLDADDPVAGRADPHYEIDFTLDPTLALFPLLARISPNADGVRDTATVRAAIVGPATQLDVVIHDQAGLVVRTLYQAPLGGEASWVFDGRGDSGAPVPDGSYSVEASATGAGGDMLDLERAVVIDRSAPWGTARRRPDGSLRVRSNENATAWGTARLRDGRRVLRRRFLPAGTWVVTYRFPGIRRLTYVDRAGNRRRIAVG